MLLRNCLYLILLSVAVEAEERPWWEQEIIAEHNILLQQNEAIEAQIKKAQLYFAEPLLRDSEKQAREYLEASEAIWRGSDEKAIRGEIDFISSEAKPYFDSRRNILELEAFQKYR